uniref:Ras-GAP domain-containing protein n=1 Tax=Romanomermis culicivorax TaxID=13658 RepID=A0A915J4N7_ROMCU
MTQKFEKFFCEICLDNCRILKTTPKLKSNDECFWGEHFELKYPVTIINGLSKTAVISLRIRARFQTVYVLPLRAYESLLEYLKSDYLTVCSAVENLTNVKAKEDIATCIVRVLHDQSLAKDFLCDLVMREVSALDNYHLLFRGNSLATKAMEAFMKLTGQTYLKQTLSEFIESTLSSKEVYEVDPSKLGNLASLSRHQDCLMKRAKAIWAKILMSAPDFPIELNLVFKELRQRLTVKGLSELADYLISSNIFLRFLCPAIMSPSLFHIVKQYPNEASVRNLTLIAKTIQNLANFTKFGSKESFMGFMNKFVEEEMENMHCFLTSISATKLNRNYDQLKDIVQSIDVTLIQAKQLRNSKASYQDSSWVKTASRSLSMSVTSRDDENVECAEIVCDGRQVMRDQSLSLAESNYDNNNNDKDGNERRNRSKIEEIRVNDHLANYETYFQENLPVEIDPMKKYSNRRYTVCAGSTKIPINDHDEDLLKQLQNNFAAAAKSLTSPLSSSTATNTGDCCSFYERFHPVENSSRCSLANEQAGSSGYHSSTYSTSHSNSPIENAACNCCSCRQYALECTTLDVQPQILSAKNRKASRRPSVDASRTSTSENCQDITLLSTDRSTKRRQASSRERSPSLLSLPNFLSTFRRTSESLFHFKADNTKNVDLRRDVEKENFCSTNRLSYTGTSRFFTPPFSRWRQSSTTPINRSLANRYFGSEIRVRVQQNGRSFVTAQSTISINSEEKNLSKLRLTPATNQSKTTASLDCRSKSSSQSISSFGGRSNAVPRTNPRFVMNGLRNSFKSLTNTLPNTLNNTFKASTVSKTGKNRSTTLPSFNNGREVALEKSIQSLNFDNDDVILRDVSFTLSHEESDSNRASP